MANENTTSLDLPPALARILGMQTEIPSFQDGGIVGNAPRYYGSFGPEVLGGADRLQRMFGATNRGVRDLITRDEYGNPKMLPASLVKRVLMDPESVPYQEGLAKLYAAKANPGLRAPAGGAYGGGTGGGLGYGGPTTYFPSVLNQDRKKPTVTVEEMPEAAGPQYSVSIEADGYAEGGMVGMEGMRVPPGAVPGMPMAGVNPEMSDDTPMDSQAMQMQVNQVASRHPQAMAEIRNAIMEELQSGDLTPQELNMIVQLTQVAAGNPEMYPYVKQFAMQQGLAAAGDLPDQYDQGLVMVLLLAARAVQQDLGGAPAETGQMPANAGPVIPSMRKGGMLPASGKSEPVIIKAHTGEYVIPKHVVDMKGKEFFDSLIEKYKDKK